MIGQKRAPPVSGIYEKGHRGGGGMNGGNGRMVWWDEWVEDGDNLSRIYVLSSRL